MLIEVSMDTQDGESQDKFTIVESELYAKLRKVVNWLAYSNQNPNNIMMSYDELVSELSEELVKGLQHYADKPIDELEALIRTILSNRIGELKHKHYNTHRKAQNYQLSLDAEIDGDITIGESVQDDASRPESILASRERVKATRRRLSHTSQQVFDAVIFGDDRLSIQIALGIMRSNHVFKEPKVYLKTWQIADALGIEDGAVKAAFREIKQAYSEVLND